MNPVSSYKTVSILKVQPYRSPPAVNVTDNMVRGTMTCSRNEWRNIKRHLLPPTTKEELNGCH